MTFSYVWGDLLSDLERRSPDLRIVNLETSVTTSEEALPKGINYRMHPANVPCLTAAKIDCCALANNHLLDWGVPGLRETLEALAGARIATAGAGRSAEEAGRPAVLEAMGKGRVQVFGFGMPSSGIPLEWAASETRSGVNLLPDSSPRSVSGAVAHMRRWRRPGDRTVASIHWGGNWGYDVSREQRELAHRLIEGGVDVVHGHSSHHPKGIEVYEGRLVLYGCGDLLNDYEGISGQWMLLRGAISDADVRFRARHARPVRNRRKASVSECFRDLAAVGIHRFCRTRQPTGSFLLAAGCKPDKVVESLEQLCSHRVGTLKAAVGPRW